jgi:hypothetical protein
MSTQASVTSYNTMIAGYLNRSFMSAIDIITIGADIMSMDKRPDAQEILDEEEFMMLSSEVISDLIDEEPDTGRLPDAKVQFI